MNLARESGARPAIGGMRWMRLALCIVAGSASICSRETEYVSAHPSSDTRGNISGVGGAVARHHGATSLTARATTFRISVRAASGRAAASSPAAPATIPRSAASLTPGSLSSAFGDGPLALERVSSGLGVGTLAPLTCISRVSGQQQ